MKGRRKKPEDRFFLSSPYSICFLKWWDGIPQMLTVLVSVVEAISDFS